MYDVLFFSFFNLLKLDHIVLMAKFTVDIHVDGLILFYIPFFSDDVGE